MVGLLLFLISIHVKGYGTGKEQRISLRNA
jgi:hypothetical protein